MVNQRLICVYLVIITASSANGFDTNIDVYNPHSGKNKISLLQEAFLNGDTDAGGYLSLAWALGIGTEQDLKSADFHSHALVSSGAARAHTTLALLLHHNLTEQRLPKEERESKALENYAIAAVMGDPLAQIVISEHYAIKEDCESAISHSRRAAEVAMHSVQELEFSRPSFVQYINEDDSPIALEMFPTQEKLQLFEYLASHGDANAAFEAAAIYMGGAPGLEKDISKAEDLLRIAIEGNNTLAMVYEAQLYLRGMSNISGEEAFQLLQTAVDYGVEIAYSGIGRFYLEGRGGFEKDLEKAEEFLTKGIEAGNVDAFYQLGKLYELKGDTDKAAELFYLPAAIGHVYSAWKLAEYYRGKYQNTSSLAITANKIQSNANFLTNKICEAAIPLYRTVALSGSWKNLFDDAYEDYLGNKKNAALLKYLLLSDLGYSAGHINAARILDEGNSEVYNSSESSDERAFMLWKRVTDSGLGQGFVRVGDYLYYGIGHPKDLAAAALNYRNAYLQKDAEGMFSYALINQWGEGVNQNISRAREIFNQLYTTHPESQVPVALALARLEFFNWVNNTFSVDIYQVNVSFSTSKDVFKLADKIVPNWDVFLIALLLCVMIFCICYRR